MKTETSQYIQSWTRKDHNFKESQTFFTECLKEQTSHRHNLRKQKIVWYHLYPRTSIVLYLNYPKFDFWRRRSMFEFLICVSLSKEIFSITKTLIAFSSLIIAAFILWSTFIQINNN